MAATAREQLLLELINEARLDPLGNAERYISQYTPSLKSNDTDIDNAFKFFTTKGVPALNGATVLSDFSNLKTVEPLAWNDEIEAAADFHNQVLMDNNVQTHRLLDKDKNPIEPSLGQRFTNAGYNWDTIAENVFSASESVLYGHAGFMVDWGNATPGHRNAIMNIGKFAHFREIGISIGEDSGPGTDDFGNKFDMGPLVITEEFGDSPDIDGKVIIVGVAYNDSMVNDDFYSVSADGTTSEGNSAVQVAIGADAASAVTSTGGYSRVSSLTGTQTVHFTNGGLASEATFAFKFEANHNYKLDLVDANTAAPIIQTSVSGTMGGSATILKGLSAAGLALTTDKGTQTIIGARGNDTLNGGADGDKLDGGLGTGDTVSYTLSGAGVTIDLGKQGTGNALTGVAGAAQAGGDAAGDLLWNIESVIGSAFADFLKGGTGNDTLKGGGGGDTFIYAAGLKTDTIADFTKGLDIIDLKAFDTIHSLADLKSTFSVTGAVDAKIDFTGGNVLIVKGIAAAALTESDFKFLNVGDPPTDISINKDTIAESAKIGDVVGQLDATDKEGGIFTFSLLTNPGNLFKISGSNLVVNGTLDFETAPNVDIKVRVTDNGKNTFDKVLTIDVTDVNGNVIVADDGNNKIDAVNEFAGLPATQEEDIITGAAGNDIIDALGGDDKVTGGAGNDILKGGAGIDTADYSGVAGATGSVTVSLASAASQDTKGAGKDTLTLFENLIGSDFADALTGSLGKNVLEGGTGDDMLSGGTGNDTLDGGANIDTASFASFTAGVTVDLLTSKTATSKNAAVTDTDTLISIENVVGGKGHNSITGDNNDNVIEGGLGNDTLDGKGGTDMVSFAGSLVGVSVVLGIAGMQDTKGAGKDTILDFEGVIGSGKDDKLQASVNGDTIMGGAGNDTIIGGGGDDELDGGNGIDLVSYAGTATGVTVNLSKADEQDTVGAGKDTLSGFENLTGSDNGDTLTGDDNANIILGGKGDDTLAGGKGNDKLDGGEGDDTVLGGDGNDTLIGGLNTAVGDTVSFAGKAAVAVNLSIVAAQDTKGAGKDTIAGFENLTGGDGNDLLTGDGKANVIMGGAGDDLLIGGAGNDKLDGGAHETAGDTVSYAALTVAVAVDLNNDDASYLIGKVADDDIVSNIENAIGGKGHDTLIGDGSANVLEGGLGNDTLTGGGGKDTASYAGSAAAVTVDLTVGAQQNTVGAGKDTLLGFANLIGGKGNDLLIGDGADNTLDGGLGNDTLVGGDGKDALIGGGGIDTASYKDAATSVTVELVGGAGIGDGGEAKGDTLAGIANLTGGSAGDVFEGDDNVNVLLGNAGDDSLFGGKGNDTLTGGDGNDTLNGGQGDDKLTADGGLPAKNGTADTVAYTGAAIGLSVSLAITAAQNTLGAGKDTISGFENLTGGLGNDLLFGDGKDNMLDGSTGDDTLNGGLGDDKLNGSGHGAPGDTASFAGGAAVVVDLLAGTATGQGADQLQDIENLIGSGAADTLTGDSKDNVIEGGLGNDILSGGETLEVNGDTASYAGAAAAVTVDLSAGTASGGAGKDTLANFENILGSKGKDLLTGDDKANTIDGGAGNDTIIGGDGVDTLIGGLGNDLFRFTAPGDGGDDILDFSTAGDKISIVKAGFGIDLAVKIGGAGANSFANEYFAADTATKAHGQFIYDTASFQLFWDDDGTGGNAATLIADLPDGSALLATHFELK